MTKNKYLKQLEGFKKQKNLLVIFVFLLIIVLLWVMVGLLSSQNKLKVSSNLKNLARILVPNIDESVFASLEQKNFYSDQELESFPIYKLIELNKGTFQKVKIDFSE